MVILMAGVIFAEPDVDIDADADAEMMLSWKIRLLCDLLKKVNDKQMMTMNDDNEQHLKLVPSQQQRLMLMLMLSWAMT